MDTTQHSAHVSGQIGNHSRICGHGGFLLVSRGVQGVETWPPPVLSLPPPPPLTGERDKDEERTGKR